MFPLANSSNAQWSSDPIVNNAICTQTGDQMNLQIVGDGSGGAIIVWEDYRSGTADIYAQRINSSGNTVWTADGVAICTATSNQVIPQMVGDGSGGAIITWKDYRNNATTGTDIYAQRINSSGTVQWTADGVAISTATNIQDNPQITGDGSGGAIITWNDYRDNVSYDIFAQRINSSGTVQWTTDGVGVCVLDYAQVQPKISSDGSGGAIIMWEDMRGGQWDLYSQRINSSGVKQWATNGVVICNASGNKDSYQMISDGSGGAIMAWRDPRSGVSFDIYAQKINTSGSVQWGSNELAICTKTDTQQDPQLVSDGSGGAIITWSDRRGVAYDIYAQSITSTGTVRWTTDGITICTATNDQVLPQIAKDTSGSTIVAWADLRGGTTYDIYTQKIDSSGAVQWTANGATVCTAANTQSFPNIVSNGNGGAIIAWEDSRGGSNKDIYISRVTGNGVLPVELVSFLATKKENGIELVWKTATETNNYGYEIQKRVVNGSLLTENWEKIGLVPGAGTSGSPHEYSFVDGNVTSGRYAYRINQIDKDGSFKYGKEVEVEVGLAPKEFNLVQNYPNPFNPSTTIEFTVPVDGRATLKVFDVLGREVAGLFDGESKAGYYNRVVFDASRLASGLYFARLEFGGKQILKKMVLMK